MMENDDFFTPLGWGLTKGRLKDIYEKEIFSCGEGYASFREVVLRNFVGDCGALQMYSANYATKKEIGLAVDLASRCGFSKIFATIVKEYDDESQRDADIADRFPGWIVVSKGKSNRNEYKDDIVLVYINKDCIYKGY